MNFITTRADVFVLKFGNIGHTGHKVQNVFRTEQGRVHGNCINSGPVGQRLVCYDVAKLVIHFKFINIMSLGRGFLC